MIGKKSFMSVINCEDKLLLSKLFDKITLSEKTNKAVFSNEFYPPNIWKKIQQMSEKFTININSFGVFEEAERRMLSFSTEDVDGYPIDMIKIVNKSKFTNLEHRDYLGALMSLGINREKMGDLVVEENTCFVPICRDIEDYIISSMSYVGKTPCIIERIDINNVECIKSNFKEKVILIASSRIDVVISAIFGISRTVSENLISSGKVMVDYCVEYKKDKTIVEDNIITIRGFGKYKVSKEIGTSAKGKKRIAIMKYI